MRQHLQTFLMIAHVQAMESALHIWVLYAEHLN